MSALKREAALRCNMETLAKGGDLRMWTLTFRDAEYDVSVVSRCWNLLRTKMRKEWPGLQGVRVYEVHPGGHGIHIHFVTNRFLDVVRVRWLAQESGFGRTHVSYREGTSAESVAGYLSKYLSKAREQGGIFSGVRVYGTFGLRGVGTTQRDIEVTSPFGIIWRAAASRFPSFPSLPWFSKVETVQALHARWVRDEVADPREWVDSNLVPIRTIQTGAETVGDVLLRDGVEAARAAVEIRLWDWAERQAERDVWRAREFERWNRMEHFRRQWAVENKKRLRAS